MSHCFITPTRLASHSTLTRHPSLPVFVFWPVHDCPAVQSLERVVDENSPSGGYAMAQILYDVFEQRTGSPLGGIILFAIFPMMAVYTCSMSSLTYAAR